MSNFVLCFFLCSVYKKYLTRSKQLLVEVSKKAHAGNLLKTYEYMFHTLRVILSNLTVL